MVIDGDDLSQREKALQQVLTHIEKIESFLQTNDNQNTEIELMSFVPEGLVAVTIGHRGRLI